MSEPDDLLAHPTGDPITIANEFAEVQVVRVETRNGSRLLIESPNDPTLTKWLEEAQADLKKAEQPRETGSP